MTVTRMGPCCARWRRSSIRDLPATVSFATTRMWRGSALMGDHLLALGHLGPVAVHDRVASPAHAVLVRAADDLRDLVEVEHGWRGGHLPLERECPPRVRRRRLSPAP